MVTSKTPSPTIGAISSLDEQPIVALCTPQGSGAIAVIRISGDGAIDVANKITKLSSSEKLINLPTHTIHHGHIIQSSEIIDEVLIFLMRAPKTFTGQDTVEISCHNNSFLINKIISQAIAHGARHAQRGEFTKRAFLNKKIDLLQAEAINDLISAQNEFSLKKSMSQLKGSLSSHIEQIEKAILILLSLVEASFEFLDEEQRDLDFDNSIKQELAKIINQISLVLKDFSQQQHIRQGVRIALIGSTNVGKSTLFNTLVKQERAIVTEIPGTTRDAIEIARYKDGNFWSIVDTAGLRKTKNEIEQKGIDRSWQEAAQSDIILFILDATKNEFELHDKIKKAYPEKVITVANKIDAATKVPPEAIPVSAKNGTGIQKLEEKIEEKIKMLFASAQSPFLLNQRQYNLLVEMQAGLQNLVGDKVHHEIMAHQLKELLEIVSQLSGRTINEQMINEVFNSFCVGK